jgi:hypothetical protein
VIERIDAELAARAGADYVGHARVTLAALAYTGEPENAAAEGP